MQPTSGIQLIDHKLLDDVRLRARQSNRLRANHNFHSSYDENPQRFLNAMIRGTYVRPHRHARPRPESLLMLSGELAYLIFRDDGTIESTTILGRDALGIDVPAGLWHTGVAITPEVVCYEVKPGPYLPETDKEFAPWAPAEGDPEATEYLRKLESLVL
jgi:cupin fold WbuC family metalloprotein